MISPLTTSAVPLVFDALPALKVRHYFGGSPNTNVYSYARMYIFQHSLAFSLCAFERDPHPESRIELAIGVNEFSPQQTRGLQAPDPPSPAPTSEALSPPRKNKKSMLLYSLGPNGAELFVCENGVKTLVPMPPPLFFLSDDEQGWYWGAQTTLPPSVLAQVGCHLSPGAEFSAAVFKTRTDTQAFGASFAPSASGKQLDFDRFGRFTAVLY